VGFLKKGGMGAVYQAHDAAGKLWAIKEMSDAAIAPGERPQAVADFKREAELLSTLRHPNLPAALPAFFEDGKWYFALDFARPHPGGYPGRHARPVERGHCAEPGRPALQRAGLSARPAPAGHLS